MRFGDKDSTTEIFLAFGLTPLQMKNDRLKPLKNSQQPVKINPAEWHASLQETAEAIVTHASRQRR